MFSVSHRQKFPLTERPIGEIGKGFNVLLGVVEGDTDEQAILLAGKIARLRVFEDENGKMNLSVNDVGGEILAISQFTLCADCKRQQTVLHALCRAR